MKLVTLNVTQPAALTLVLPNCALVAGWLSQVTPNSVQPSSVTEKTLNGTGVPSGKLYIIASPKDSSLGVKHQCVDISSSG